MGENNKTIEEKIQLASIVFDSVIEGIIIIDTKRIIKSVNQAFSNITGYSAKESIGKDLNLLQSDKHDSQFYNDMWTELKKKGEWKGEVWSRRKNGETFPNMFSLYSVKDKQGKVIDYVAIFNEITELKLKEAKIEYQAFHDPLTGLPNRNLLYDRLKMAISRAKRTEKMIGILFLDLDNFKNINDAHGHVIGEYLLKDVAKRLLECMRAGDTVARLGGDEYTVLLPQISDPKEIVYVAQRIMNSFKEPFVIQGFEFFVTSSIGISIYPSDGENTIELLKSSDLALHHAKKEGRNNYQFYSKQMNVQIKKRLKLENELRQALKKDQFMLYYQPIIHIDSGEIIGVEALIRWNHDELGIVTPLDFIPLAEETRLIIPIGEWVLKTACEQCNVWRDMGYSELNMSVNVSSLQFHQRDFFKNFKIILEKTKFDMDYLTVEITENSIMGKTKEIIDTMRSIKRIGVKISIDDFGTGYSSLNYLKRFPIHTLKIDRSFIMDIPKDPDSVVITKAIISLAKALKLEVVAESVERKDQLDFLKENNCDYIQGYYFCRPIPADKITEFIKEKKNFYK